MNELRKKIEQLAGDEWRERERAEIRVMIMGMPNVGKSSLVNALRRTFLSKAKAAATGNEPGVTRSVQMQVKISKDPPIALVDTPGIMMPKIFDPETALKLALIGTLRDSQVGEGLIADYLLFTLNQHQNFKYVKRYKMEEPNDDINFVLKCIAQRTGALKKGGTPNIQQAAKTFIHAYRKGLLGCFTLDSLPSSKENLSTDVDSPQAQHSNLMELPSSFQPLSPR
eukprot:m.212712 g.212712  ORF g.212712 m.212712 type:complete len:226 (+) comp26159_c0_seq2:383-1060(+)